MSFVKVDGLIKNYGDFCAVDSLSFEVEEGEIYALIGPNGAGKSTTMNIITTLDSSDKGTVTINGYNSQKNREAVRKMIGVVPQDIAVYPYLTARENVEFFASLYGLKGKALKESAERALSFTGLSDKASMKPKKMSGGMKRRLNIACGIAHNPQLIVMDEPTVGVDAQSREHILNSIKLLRDGGATIIYTSHYMQEVEAICDKITIIDKGKLIATGTEQELVAMITDCKTLHIKTKFNESCNIEQLITSIKTLPDVMNAREEEGEIIIDVKLGDGDFSYIIDELKKYSLPLISINSEVPGLDAVFLALTGHDLR